jgi:hypothetical protein
LRLQRAPISLGMAGGIALAALLAACGGGASNPPTVSGPTATPVPTATPGPTSVSTTVPLPTTATTLPLPTLNGMSVTFHIAAGAPSGTTVTATESIGAPPNAPAPSSVRRREAITGATNVFYVAMTLSQTVSSNFFPAEDLTLVSTLPTSAQYFTEIDDITSAPATKMATFGPATLTGLLAAYTNNGSNNGGGGGPPSLTVGHTYLFQFYYTPGTATPTPTPTSSASATATATPTPTPTGSSSSAPTPTPTPTPSSSPSVVPNYVFNGTTTTSAFTSTGGTNTVGPYQNVRLDTTWGQNTASSTTFTASLATGSGDISPNTFPLNTANGHVVIYLEFTATPATSFALTPNLVFTVNSPASFGGTACSLYSLNSNGGTTSTTTWKPAIGPATPSGSTVTFAPATLGQGNTVDVGNPSNGNQAYLSLACQ